ncbi:hypothetical protein HRR80_008441 [Exophiala dermatitidis]|uniref:Uncharacterized protein n=1 Tax=Exophiala dermatitidis TaxID=5970 RepID=A0AAN6IR70_EXODE|nr:hypothetical protein HRR80_008441 [Exophiala dermatitidis]
MKAHHYLKDTLVTRLGMYRLMQLRSLQLGGDGAKPKLASLLFSFKGLINIRSGRIHAFMPAPRWIPASLTVSSHLGSTFATITIWERHKRKSADTEEYYGSREERATVF